MGELSYTANLKELKIDIYLYKELNLKLYIILYLIGLSRHHGPGKNAETY